MLIFPMGRPEAAGRELLTASEPLREGAQPLEVDAAARNARAAKCPSAAKLIVAPRPLRIEPGCLAAEIKHSLRNGAGEVLARGRFPVAEFLPKLEMVDLSPADARLSE